MAGIYVDKRFNLNMKCVIFSLIMIILYYYIPCERNVYMGGIIFLVSYIGMAWYDYKYNCEKKLLSGTQPLGPATYDSIFKPRESGDEKELLPREEQERIFLRNVYLFHTTLVMPILIYIGYNGNKTDARLYGVLMGLGGIGLTYHMYRIFNPRKIIV